MIFEVHILHKLNSLAVGIEISSREVASYKLELLCLLEVQNRLHYHNLDLVLSKVCNTFAVILNEEIRNISLLLGSEKRLYSVVT